MAELIFIEGVSGVGKSTMLHKLSEKLQLKGYSVKSYAEFDYTNPIDFYCTAYIPLEKYEKLCEKYSAYADELKANTIRVGNVRLVRYYNDNIPLFSKPLLSELSINEFCYEPKNPIPLSEYTSVYETVWRIFAEVINERYDFIVFDGSLLHHPINDMMRNYNITGQQAIGHVTALLASLGSIKRRIFYLKTKDIGSQLKRVHIDRRQSAPTDEQIAFWENRYKNDMTVLENIMENCKIYDVSSGNWDEVTEEMLYILTKNDK